MSAEKVLWRGSPVRFPFLDRGVPAFVFHVIVNGVLLGFVLSFAKGGSWFQVVLVGAWATYLACYVIGGPVLRWLALHTTEYVLTEDQVITTYSVLGIRRRRVRELAELPEPELVETPDGVGTIRFGYTLSIQQVSDARSVHTMIMNLREAENAA
ncbi:hypothetical protein FKR81_25310 [Lentzea tibetensis]|uniref:DUF304 domain-containing protein n=1 Tax=Lentzea tibetensis TaxID=2591470 RepID=A0A563ENX7_9PSEU|nr:hypothetical protein [Lentzea tibetensis]TWP49001.1 hypothetical protein FKR81_25310 [Lentzea tibetensis]